MSVPGQPRATMRADKWLWHARFFKTRGLAAKVIAGGHLRVNAGKVHKPAQAVGPGDVLTFPQARRVRVVKIVALSERRGPAPEARALYDDLTPPADPTPPAPRFDGGGRPSGKDRRNARLYDRGQLD
jgi:ribosome-associated heat shock protein Hsp15